MVLRDVVLTTVIVNWNAREQLSLCLGSLQRGTHVSQAIWVVDNASSDKSADMVRRDFPDVHLITNERNAGFAAANNLALRMAEPSRYVLLLNPDTEVPDGAVDALVAYLDCHSDAGAAGVQLLNPDGTMQRSFDYFYSFAASFRRNLMVSSLLRRTPGIVERSSDNAIAVDWLIGACVIVRSEALHQIGLLDERFFMYGEEVDLQRRLHDAGWSIMMLPNIHIVHHGGASSQQVSLRMMVQEYRSRYLLIHKHSSSPTVVAYVIKAVVGLCIWSLYWGARSLVRNDVMTRNRFHAYLTVLHCHTRPRFYSRSGNA